MYFIANVFALLFALKLFKKSLTFTPMFFVSFVHQKKKQIVHDNYLSYIKLINIVCFRSVFPNRRSASTFVPVAKSASGPTNRDKSRWRPFFHHQEIYAHKLQKLEGTLLRSPCNLFFEILPVRKVEKVGNHSFRLHYSCS